MNLGAKIAKAMKNQSFQAKKNIRVVGSKPVTPTVATVVQKPQHRKFFGIKTGRVV